MLPANEMGNMHNYKQETSENPLDAANITSAAETIYASYKDNDAYLWVAYSAEIV